MTGAGKAGIAAGILLLMAACYSYHGHEETIRHREDVGYYIVVTHTKNGEQYEVFYVVDTHAKARSVMDILNHVAMGAISDDVESIQNVIRLEIGEFDMVTELPEAPAAPDDVQPDGDGDGASDPSSDMESDEDEVHDSGDTQSGENEDQAATVAQIAERTRDLRRPVFDFDTIEQIETLTDSSATALQPAL